MYEKYKEDLEKAIKIYKKNEKKIDKNMICFYRNIYKKIYLNAIDFIINSEESYSQEFKDGAINFHIRSTIDYYKSQRNLIENYETR